MPLSRGPSMKLLKLEPFVQLGQRRMTGQIDLQGSDGSKPFRHGMEIRARSGILATAGIAHQYTLRPRGSFAITMDLLRWRLPRRVTLMPRS
jgi:hypothetical protein